jgi:hypothetical protein
MDVTRATAATRVDENGLVNYAEVLGSEEIVCGDFECAVPTDVWDLSTGWTISGGKAKANLVQNQNMFQAKVYTSGKTYKVTYTISDYDNGTVRFQFGGGGSTVNGEINSSNGVYTEYITATANHTSSRFRGQLTDGGFTGNIDNISVKEVTRDNVPRIDYTGGGCPHILAEPQRTNLIPYSEDFSSWTTVSATLTPNQLSPDGTNNAYIVEDDNASGSGYEKVDVTITTTATPCTLSVFVKKKTSSVSTYSGIQMGTGFSYLIFDSYNGTYNQSSNTNYDSIEVENFNSDWWRLKLTATVTTSTRVALWGAISSNGTTISPSATGSETFWGTQLEQGSYATSYIPTSGSTVTRNQDIFTRDGIGSLINSTEGVLFVEMAALSNDGTSRQLSLSDGSSVNNKLSIIYTSTTNQIQAFIRASGSISFNVTFSLTDATTFSKIAIKWKLNDFALWVDGVEVASDTLGAAPVGLSELSFDDADGTSKFFAKVKQLQVYDTALTDEQLLQLTGESGTDFYESYAEMASALTYTIQ